MAKHDVSAEVSASPEKIWSIVSDWNYTPKLFPAVISVDVEPPGSIAVGQKTQTLAKMGGRKIDLFGEVVDVERNELWAVRARPRGLLRAGSATLTIQPTRNGSRVTYAEEIEFALGYFGKILGKLVVERALNRNLGGFLKNLKEIAERKVLP